MTRFFVTGTGTGVGKSVVTAALVREVRERGEKVRALKPVISGYPDASGAPSDSEVLLAALGLAADSDAIAEISPWRFRAPLSPDMAAAREGRTIDFERLTAFTRTSAADPGALLIEGVGGVLVPLDREHSVLDWIAASGLPPLLVAGSYLGTLSHTLCALAALRERTLRPRAIVISESLESPVSLEETRETLRRFAGDVPIALCPRVSGEKPWERCAALLPQLEDR